MRAERTCTGRERGVIVYEKQDDESLRISSSKGHDQIAYDERYAVPLYQPRSESPHVSRRSPDAPAGR